MIEGIEWLFIALIVMLLIFYDPQKIPQIAKAITQAKKEYEKAVSYFAEEVDKLEELEERKEIEKPKPWDPAFPFEHERESPDMHIVKWAKMLKIETYGKTRDEIIKEIFERQKEYFFKDKLQSATKETLKDSGESGEGTAEALMGTQNMEKKTDESETSKSLNDEMDK
ncbi:MAG: twin-arginine translocase TatA/TatE family subunit [Crenarchaeota archaeon]|nr:twin-arginine translocase TatA/TatE family subunit [Thermoproteota archaeon]